MLQNIDSKYKDKIAIVTVGYNRLHGLKRLLDSIDRAHFKDNDIPLVISIDASGNESLYEFVRNYQWNHGQKYVNIESERLGLKKHIFQCGDLTEYFKGIILLEDDLFVSPEFYNYATASLEKYDNDENVAGIAFYSNEFNGFVGLPFHPLNNGSDCFAMQSVCSWGQMWNERMWSCFKKWLVKWDENFAPFDMPETIKNWTRAWSKYFYAYIVANEKYFIFPFVSLTTNFNDGAGEHGSSSSPSVQVHLQYGHKEYHLSTFPELVKYDIYQQNISLYEKIGLTKEELSLDLYGQKLSDGKSAKYILSTQQLDMKVVKSYALKMRPIELNILEDISGNGIYLYENQGAINARSSVSESMIDYMLAWFDRSLLSKYCLKYQLNRVKGKFSK